MTEPPRTATPVVAEREDTRTNGPMLGEERAVLEHWLDLYRDTVLLKLAGLDADQLARRALPPTSMSLIGIVRHLTEVEVYWLRVVLLDKPETPNYYCTSASPDGDFDDINPSTAAADVATYQSEVVTSRANTAAWNDLAVPVRGRRSGQQVNLRWILVHLIEEYARHLGHMDLLREAVDGRAGYRPVGSATPCLHSAGSGGAACNDVRKGRAPNPVADRPLRRRRSVLTCLGWSC